jgi:hypothetical protein
MDSSIKFTTKENISNLILNIHRSNLIMAITYLFQAITKKFHYFCKQTSDLVLHLLLMGGETDIGVLAHHKSLKPRHFHGGQHLVALHNEKD